MELSAWRRGNGWTLAELGDRLGVSEASVSRYERGRIPEPEVMRRILDLSAGQVTPNDFFGLTANPPSPSLQSSNDTPPRGVAAGE